MRRAGAGPIEQYVQWKHRNEAVGCLFARVMAGKPSAFGQRYDLLIGADPAALAGAVERCVSGHIADPSALVAALILPDLTELGGLVSFANALKNVPQWRMTAALLADAPGGPVVAFRIARDILLASGTPLPSEALVLGDFPTFPATRRAPVTALELFVGTPPACDFSGMASQKANIADALPALGLAQPIVDYQWRATRAARLKSLGCEDARAKAKNSFVVPLDVAQRLGCEP